jgi:hypothetical protein
MSLSQFSGTGNNLPTISEEKPLSKIEYPVVVKDNDGLLITISMKQYNSLPQEAFKELNTYIKGHYEKMVANLVKLLLHLSPEKPTLHNSMSVEEREIAKFQEKKLINTFENYININYDIKHFGAGNAYECYIAHQLNRTDTMGRDPLSPAWKIIVKENNISETLAMNLRDTAKAEANVIILRLDERTSPHNRRDSARKPSIIKLKVCNWAWMNECIPKDQSHLGKTSHGSIIPSDQYQTPHTKNPENFTEQIAVKQLTLTCQEIIDSLVLGNTIIDEENTTEEYLAVKPVPGKNNAPNDTQVTFRANMTPGESITLSEEKSNPMVESTIAKPSFWKNSWGDFNLSLQNHVKAEYKLSKESDFIPLEIYAIPILKNEKILIKTAAFNPIQHGFENHNPGIQSNIDSLSLAVNPIGAPHKLINEKKLIKYLVDSTENQVFHINQSWDMKQGNWGQLVESQIKLGVDVAPTTVTALLREYNTNDLTQLDKPLLDHCLALAEKLGEDGRETRQELCHYVAKTLQPDSIFTREDFNKIQSQVNKYDLISKDDNKRSGSEEAYKILKERYTSCMNKQQSSPSTLIAEVKQQENMQSKPEDHQDCYRSPKPNT